MKAIAAALATLALITAGCGGSSSPSSTPSTSSASTTPAASVTISTGHVAGLGTLLVNAQRHTLYMFLPDKHSRVTCVGSCASVWPPVFVTGGAKALAAGQAKASLLGSDPDPTGGRVVTYAGWPLYTYAGDSATGTATGQDQNVNGGYWYALTPAGKLIHVKPG